MGRACFEEEEEGGLRRWDCLGRENWIESWKGNWERTGNGKGKGEGKMI